MFARTLVSLLLALTASFTATAGMPVSDFSACPEHFAAGRPPAPPASPGQVRALCFNEFAVLHSGETKTAVYVAQHLTPAGLRAARQQERTDRFYEEARLPGMERARLSDYRRSGFDRGHLAEAAAMATPEGMAQSFSLANMVPQAPEHNRGLWAKNVELATRKYVERGNEVYVLTGPLYTGSSVRTIGDGRVWVPDKLFKLVYDPRRRQAWAHVSDNVADTRMRKPLTYTQFVALTGREWLPAGAVARE